MVPLKVTPKRA